MAKRGPTTDTYDDVPLSALLQSARNVYSNAVHREQSRIGCDDLPAAGAFIISTMHWSDASLEAVIRWMGVTKQAVSQAVDTLVLRGYLERSSNPSDRRRVNLALTERGRDAGRAARTAIERVDRELRARVGARTVADARAALITLLEMERTGRSEKDQRRKERHFSSNPYLGVDRRLERASFRSVAVGRDHQMRLPHEVQSLASRLMFAPQDGQNPRFLANCHLEKIRAGPMIISVTPAPAKNPATTA